MKVGIRWMIRRDMLDVLDIERACFELPLTEEEIVAMLRQPNTVGMVAVHRDRVVGHMIYSLCNEKIVLLNIAVDPRYQRRGIGSQMVGKLTSKLELQRRNTIEVWVRETELGPLAFFKRHGFFAEELCRRWFDTEDAIIMRHRVHLPVTGWRPENRITKFLAH